MRAAIVFLADTEIQNRARRDVFLLNTRYRTPFFASVLPCHVSLKQPFAFEDMERLEAYFDGLARSVPPLPIQLDHYYCLSGDGWGLVGFNVVETPELRALHNRLNAELPAIVNDARAEHDGEAYRFHLTIEMGRIEGNVNPYREFYEQIVQKDVNLAFLARQLGLFYYEEPRSGALNGFIHYRSQALS